LQYTSIIFPYGINPLNAELNPICHFLALLGALHILHISRIRVNRLIFLMELECSLRCTSWIFSVMWTNFSLEGLNLRTVYLYEYFRCDNYFYLGEFYTKV